MQNGYNMVKNGLKLSHLKTKKKRLRNKFRRYHKSKMRIIPIAHGFYYLFNMCSSIPNTDQATIKILNIFLVYEISPLEYDFQMLFEKF